MAKLYQIGKNGERGIVGGVNDYDRFYFEGRHLSDDHRNRIDVGDGPFASFRCDFRW